MDHTLLDSLTVTIVDKLIIGVMLLAAGYFVKKKFEFFKERQGLEASINNKRVEAIGEVLAKVTDYESVLKQVAMLGVEAAARSSESYRARLKECKSPAEMTLLLEHMSKELNHERERNLPFIAVVQDLRQKISISREKHSLAEEAINKNHFWIGRAFYFEMTNRVGKWDRFLECVKLVDKERVDSLYSETISEMRDVSFFAHQQFNP